MPVPSGTRDPWSDSAAIFSRDDDPTNPWSAGLFAVPTQPASKAESETVEAAQDVLRAAESGREAALVSAINTLMGGLSEAARGRLSKALRSRESDDSGDTTGDDGLGAVLAALPSPALARIRARLEAAERSSAAKKLAEADENEQKPGPNPRSEFSPGFTP